MLTLGFETHMGKNYAYRMDHDTGFAPHVEGGLCFLSGCKKTTIELWASENDWVIGIGGNGTKKPDRLIYAMKVNTNLTFDAFRKKYPEQSRYLTPNNKASSPGTNVLVSDEFYYFGDKALELPKQLGTIIIDRHGCERVADEDITKLKRYLDRLGFKPGKHGTPNNPMDPPRCGGRRPRTKKAIC